MSFKIIRNDSEYISGFDEKKLKDAMDVALDCRKFEIEMYWKRANYFAIIIGAIFIAYYRVGDDLFFKWLLSFVGYSLSYAWVCLNRGSKFWQENWERNIDILSTLYGIPVFKMIRYGERNYFRVLGSFPYSVSRLNLIVSVFAFVAWLIAICYQIVQILVDSPCCIQLFMVAFAGTLILFLPVVISLLGRGFMAHGEVNYLSISDKDAIIKRE